MEINPQKCFATISDIALKWNIIIERVTYELRERETRCNARTLNTGIFLDYILHNSYIS